MCSTGSEITLISPGEALFLISVFAGSEEPQLGGKGRCSWLPT